mgnify:FL=1
MNRLTNIIVLAGAAVLSLMSVSCDEIQPEDTQGEETQTLTVSPSSMSFSANDKSSQLFTITTTSDWTATVSADWINIDTASGTGKASVTVMVDANETAEAREGTVTVSGAATATIAVYQSADENAGIPVVAMESAFDGKKRSGLTYQLLVYSFADSDGDGWGDLRGVTEHLDYLDALGVTGIWLSPIQTAASYHGYDILDYYSIDSRLGTEEDLKQLIQKAGEKDIDIYLDYVLNHSGRGDWFYDAVSSEDSPYRSYYVLSNNPTQDVKDGNVDNYGGASNPGMGGWYTVAAGDLGYTGRLHFKVDWNNKTVTVTETTDAVQSSNSAASLWLYYGGGEMPGLYETSSGIHEITVDFNSEWGFLVRSSQTSWDNGTKWGGDGSSITFGEAYSLNSSTAADITFGGECVQYFASFDRSMPDLNYGKADVASESAAFKDLAASADKWINMGVNGLRLDAVLWIYQKQAKSNIAFLQQWYDHCNATYQARGGEGDIYMVGEAWADDAAQMAPYYQGLPSNFNFYYYWTLKDRINKGKGSDFASTVLYFQGLFQDQRSDYIDAIKLSNHDEDRTGSDLGKNLDKMKLAGAVLLTSPGKPFVYHGEELGYYGTKSGGDEYIRTPIKWTKSGALASKALNNKVDSSMLTEEISVEAQEAAPESILSVYRKFAEVRNTYPALAEGRIAAVSSSVSAIGAWTMTSDDGQTVLVVHNFSGKEVSMDISAYLTDKPLVTNGTVTISGGTTLNLGAYSSVVFLQ